MRWYFLFLIVASLNLLQAESNDNDYTLGVQEPEGPTVLGIEFGRKINKLAQVLEAMGLVQVARIEEKDKGAAEVLNYDGVPKGLVVGSGKTQLKFFQDSLIQMSIEFTPSYEHFLMIRKQLLSSLGPRFTIEKKEEAMDDLLRAYLAGLEHEALDRVSEDAIARALERGHTFWYYQLKDSQGILNVVLSYSVIVDAQKSRKPALFLLYSWIQGNQRLKDYEKNNQVKILPEYPR